MSLRDIKTLSLAEISRLRLLNEKLAQIQTWGQARAVRCLQDYPGSAEKVGAPSRTVGEWSEDIDLEAEVTCMLRRDHPEFDPEDDNYVTALWSHWAVQQGLWPSRYRNWNSFWAWKVDHPFRSDHHCWLFHTLYEHAMSRNWDRMLDIGELWIDVKTTCSNRLTFDRSVAIPGERVVTPASGDDEDDGEWSRRGIDDLDEAELEQLRFLNRKLEEAQRWANERGARLFDDYFRAGGRRRFRIGKDLQEDVELEVKVRCLLSEDHPEFDPDDDNFVATLSSCWHEDEAIWPPGGDWDENWNECGSSRPDLRSERHCWLFHDLYDHELRRDWDRILGIGGLWVEVTLIQQRMVHWT